MIVAAASVIATSSESGVRAPIRRSAAFSFDHAFSTALYSGSAADGGGVRRNEEHPAPDRFDGFTDLGRLVRAQVVEHDWSEPAWAALPHFV